MEIPEAVRLHCQRVDELQADDRARFVASTSALLQRFDLSRGVLTAMTCDGRFSTLFANWAAACDRHDIDVRATTLVFPTDEEARERIESLGFVAYFDDQSELLREMRPSGSYGDWDWVGYMFHQNWVIAEMLALEVDVLFQDVDIVWRHDPVPTLQAQAAEGAHIQAMYDGPNSRFQPLYVNSGFMYFRNAPEVRDVWAEVCARHELVAYYGSQQEPLNVLLAAHAHRGLDIRVLDEERFANGHRYCGGRTPPADPWVVHLSWTADLAMKLERYAAHDLWFLDEPAPLEPASPDSAPPDSAPPDSAPPDSAPPDSASLDSAPSGSVVVNEASPIEDDPAVRDRPTPAHPDGEVGELLGVLAGVRRERDALAGRLAAMERSMSWRVTAPMRRASDAWSRRRR